MKDSRLSLRESSVWESRLSLRESSVGKSPIVAFRSAKVAFLFIKSSATFAERKATITHLACALYTTKVKFTRIQQRVFCTGVASTALLAMGTEKGTAADLDDSFDRAMVASSTDFSR